MQSQTLYRGRYPFIVTQLTGGGIEMDEFAFAADPEQDVTQLPTAKSGGHALDLVRLTVRNTGAETMLRFASLGWCGVNLHGGGNGFYTPIAGTPSTGFMPRPEYFGIQFGQSFAGATFLAASLTVLAPMQRRMRCSGRDGGGSRSSIWTTFP